jgi:hypothetical protein
VAGYRFGVLPEVLMCEDEDAHAAIALIVDQPEVICRLLQFAETGVNTEADIPIGVDSEKGRTIAKLPAAVAHILLYFTPGADPQSFHKGDEVEAIDLDVEGG